MVKLSPPRPVKARVSSPTRAVNTVYQNTSGRPMLIIAILSCNRASVVGAYAMGLGKTEAVTPPTVVQTSDGLMSQDNNPDQIKATIIIIVPNQYYYSIVSSAGGVGSTVGLDGNVFTEVEL